MREPLKYIEKDAVCAEIGVWKGDFSSEILEREPSKLHLIDPWICQELPWRPWYSCPQKKMDLIFKDVQKKFPIETVKIHRDFSTNVAFPTEYFDWVYIDGNHSYKAVLADLNHYYPLMKKGSFLCGDDYGWSTPKCKDGPKKAVDEFVEKHGLELIVKGDAERGGPYVDKFLQFIIKV